MQAASRESYTAARAALEESARAAGAAATAVTADEVLAFAALLDREPRLRRALSDPSRPGDQRGELVRSLLSGKVGQASLDLLVVLASGRWSAASELLDAAERLGADALLASADQAGDLAEVEDELFRFGQIVAGDPALAGAIGDFTVPASRRIELVHGLLAGKAKPSTVRLAELAVGGFGGRSFANALTRLVEMAAERREAQVAYVTVAKPLTDAEESRLASSLSGIYGRTISIKVTVDPTVLGGLCVKVGSDLYDGTVAKRLAAVRNALVGK
ncbi:ATP synthase subunit delta [Catellatospora sp. TT07R-123]|uniref:F0F1 ATP synthase subunit delta n=1 Tax=Catellatospora sp. TT07R-123 TaxID=2733863 RepID=UPI001B174E1C|nr:F0F1 ATP synthase subunit delta [Catellatospora sp. TT07R-123]GHJ50018.1 ATP synthase subunit delta [Catellatospora sp. TT07R-123]